MKRTLLKMAITQGPRLFPGLMAFLRWWWWALLLAVLLLGGLALWIGISLLLWAWETLPHVLGYFINHFAPAFEGLPQGPAESATL